MVGACYLLKKSIMATIPGAMWINSQFYNFFVVFCLLLCVSPTPSSVASDCSVYFLNGENCIRLENNSTACIETTRLVAF